MVNKFENPDTRIELPQEFDGVSNKEHFVDVFEKVKSWYGEDFSDQEKEIIKEVWNKGCKNYGYSLNKMRLAILGNRIDFSLFEFRYPTLIGRDREIRRISDANEQRRLRAIEIEKINKTRGYSSHENDNMNDNNNDNSQSGVIENDQSSIIDNNESGNTGSNNNTPSNTGDHWPSNVEIQEMLNKKISPFFEEIKKELFQIESLNNSENKKYIEGFFNECACSISDLYGHDFENIEGLKEELLIIFKEHGYAISEGFEKSSGKLIDDVKNKIFGLGSSINTLVNNAFNENDNKIDYSKLVNYTLTEEDTKSIKFLCNKLSSEKDTKGHNKYTEEEITNNFFKYRYLENKLNTGTLTKEEKESYKKLKELFNQTKRLRKLEEIRGREYIGNHRYRARNIRASVEYATGNMKDVQPIAIVENNKQISKYIYGDKRSHETLHFDSINLPDGERIRLFNKLKNQKKGDEIFGKSIKYLNDDLSINEELVNIDRVDINSVRINQQKIENMIKDLALGENLEMHGKKKINEINVRKSCMVCCFRAISSFFDTVNNNGENFASEFEIEDVNENIEFDEKTGIIKIKGTIGGNKNHIGLYYNTHTGELSFDNFLAFNPDVGYKIGKGNGERELLKVTLPTMDKMEAIANSINFNLIDNLSLNMIQYNRMVGMAMSESIWFNCFKGFMGADMEVNKQFVAQFTEKNILKQDIIKTIYKKFYSERDLDDIFNNENKYLTVGEGNEPEQFKLIKLISDSIDHYESADQLLNFRLYINQLDKFLASKTTIQKDKLLRALFADNLSSDNDNYDISRQVMQRENENLSVSDNTTNTYVSHEQSSIEGNNKKLGDYILLDLFSEDKGGKRIINLDWLSHGLDIMSRTDNGLGILDMADEYAGFEKNLQLHADELPDFRAQILQENIEQIA